MPILKGINDASYPVLLHIKVTGLNLFYRPKTPLLVKC